MFLKLIRQALFTVQLGLEMQLQKLISAPLLLATPYARIPFHHYLFSVISLPIA